MSNNARTGKEDSASKYYRGNGSMPTAMASIFMLVNEQMTQTQQWLYYIEFNALVVKMEQCRRAYIVASDSLWQEFFIEHRVFRDALYRLAFQKSGELSV